jgi:hypothetical protein
LVLFGHRPTAVFFARRAKLQHAMSEPEQIVSDGDNCFLETAHALSVRAPRSQRLSLAVCLPLLRPALTLFPVLVVRLVTLHALNPLPEPQQIRHCGSELTSLGPGFPIRRSRHHAHREKLLADIDTGATPTPVLRSVARQYAMLKPNERPGSYRSRAG